MDIHWGVLIDNLNARDRLSTPFLLACWWPSTMSHRNPWHTPRRKVGLRYSLQLVHTLSEFIWKITPKWLFPNYWEVTCAMYPLGTSLDFKLSDDCCLSELQSALARLKGEVSGGLNGEVGYQCTCGRNKRVVHQRISLPLLWTRELQSNVPISRLYNACIRVVIEVMCGEWRCDGVFTPSSYSN